MFHLVLTAVLLPGLAVPALFPFTVLAVAVIGCLFAAAETVRCFPLPAEPRPWYVDLSRRRPGVLSFDPDWDCLALTCLYCLVTRSPLANVDDGKYSGPPPRTHFQGTWHASHV